MARTGLTWKQTATGGKYFSNWNANRQVVKDGKTYNVHGTIERRYVGKDCVFTWTLDSNHGMIAKGKETGSTATLAICKQDASIALSDWLG